MLCGFNVPMKGLTDILGSLGRPSATSNLACTVPHSIVSRPRPGVQLMAAVAYRVDTSGQYLVVYKIIVIFGNLLKFCSDYTSRRVEDMRNYGRTRTAVETAAGLVAGHPLHNDASSLLMAFALDMALW